MDVNVHALGPVYASHFVKCGGKSEGFTEILGHANIKTTMRYAHLSREHKKEAVKLCDGLTTSNSMPFYVMNSEKLSLPQNSRQTAVM
jgi:hypothetical protein